MTFSLQAVILKALVCITVVRQTQIITKILALFRAVFLYAAMMATEHLLWSNFLIARSKFACRLL
jgi:hypothetical protein